MPAALSREFPTSGLRLLNVASSIDPAAGGISEAIVRMSRALVGLGHEVETLTVDDPQSPWASSLPMPAQLKGPPHGRLEYSYEFHRWLFDNAGRFDAILTHGLWRYNSRATRRAARAASRPYFVFPHGMLDPWFKRKYWAKHLGKSAYWWLAEEAVLRDASAVLFACDEERDLARKSFRPYRCVERVVPLGTDEPPPNVDEQRRSFSEKFPELAGKRVILFLGRLHEKKGCDLLLRAFLVLLQAQPKEARYDLHLMLAGPCAQPEYLRELQQLAAKCDEFSPGSVSFAGMLSGDLKWGALRAAEAFILPSHQENFGMAVVEALACGTPVLLSRAVNIGREIEESGAGLAEPDTLAGCSRLLERWLAVPPAERRAMAGRATACFHQRFEITQTARRLIHVIREFLPATPPAAAA
jgi:glycosyltransferase involved in cell wall biosynthesis